MNSELIMNAIIRSDRRHHKIIVLRHERSIATNDQYRVELILNTLVMGIGRFYTEEEICQHLVDHVDTDFLIIGRERI